MEEELKKVKELLAKALEMIQHQRTEWTDVETFCQEIENVLGQ